MMSDSMRAPSLASAFAVSGCTAETTLVAEFNTRKRSCGSGCGSATAVLTTFNTNALRACCFCVPALAAAAAGFLGTAFGAGVFPCAAHKLTAKRTTIESKICFFISYTVGCILERKNEGGESAFPFLSPPSLGEGLPIFQCHLVEPNRVVSGAAVHIHLEGNV